MAIGLVLAGVQGRVAAAPQSELPKYSFTVEIETIEIVHEGLQLTGDGRIR